MINCDSNHVRKRNPFRINYHVFGNRHTQEVRLFNPIFKIPPTSEIVTISSGFSNILAYLVALRNIALTCILIDQSIVSIELYIVDRSFPNSSQHHVVSRHFISNRSVKCSEGFLRCCTIIDSTIVLCFESDELVIFKSRRSYNARYLLRAKLVFETNTRIVLDNLVTIAKRKSVLKSSDSDVDVTSVAIIGVKNLTLVVSYPVLFEVYPSVIRENLVIPKTNRQPALSHNDVTIVESPELNILVCCRLIVRRIRTVSILLNCVYDTSRSASTVIKLNSVNNIVFERSRCRINRTGRRIQMPGNHGITVVIRPVVHVAGCPLVIHHTIGVILTTRGKCIITTILFVEMVTIYLCRKENVYNSSAIRLDCNIRIHRVITIMGSVKATRNTASYHIGSNDTLNCASSARDRINKRPARRRSINTICMMGISPSLS